MSPKRFRPFRGLLKNPIFCSPPRIAVYLNLQLLREKGVYYRPELPVFEDIIFGYECEQNKLKVFIDNRILLQDHKWSETAARSLSVKQKMQQKWLKPLLEQRLTMPDRNWHLIKQTKDKAHSEYTILTFEEINLLRNAKHIIKTLILLMCKLNQYWSIRKCKGQLNRSLKIMKGAHYLEL